MEIIENWTSLKIISPFLFYFIALKREGKLKLFFFPF